MLYPPGWERPLLRPALVRHLQRRPALVRRLQLHPALVRRLQLHPVLVRRLQLHPVLARRPQLRLALVRPLVLRRGQDVGYWLVTAWPSGSRQITTRLSPVTLSTLPSPTARRRLTTLLSSRLMIRSVRPWLRMLSQWLGIPLVCLRQETWLVSYSAIIG